MRPDVVLIDISTWKEPLEGLTAAIRTAAGDPDDRGGEYHAADADSILAALRAGINEYLYPPHRRAAPQGARKALGGAQPAGGRGGQGGGKSFGLLSAKGGCGATTLVCHVAAGTGLPEPESAAGGSRPGRRHGRLPYQDQVHLFHSGRGQQLHRLDISYWKALVSNGIPGVEIVSSPPTLASKQQPTRRPNPARAGLRAAALRLVVADLGRSLSRIAMAALEEIDEACVVTTLEVPALHQAKQIIQTLLDSGYGKHRIRLVLNRTPKRLDITPGEFEKMLGVPDLRHDSERLSGVVRDLRRGPAVEPDQRLSRQISVRSQTGWHRRREARRGTRRNSGCSDNAHRTASTGGRDEKRATIASEVGKDDG